MTSVEIGLAGMAGVIFLISFGMPIGLTLIGVSFLGIWAIIGIGPALSIVGSTPYSFSAEWGLSSVPMFLLMGYICFNTSLTFDAFNAARAWLSRLPGALACASVMGSAGFAAVSGSSVANAAAMGKIAIPEMLDSNYSPALATGSVAAAGTIGALISPSIIMILYGIFGQVPISKLFAGGVFVGALTALSYVVLIVVMVWLKPSLAPASIERISFRDKVQALVNTWPLILIAVSVFGGLFSGVFSATEAGSIGVIISIGAAYLRRSLTRKAMMRAMMETAVTTTSLFIIAIGASLLTRFMAVSGVGNFMSDAIMMVGSDTLSFLLVVTVIFIILGMFLEPIGIMLLTLPVIFPVLDGVGIDKLWFGIFMIKLLEIGMITPPIGLNVFVVKAAVGDRIPISQIFRGIGMFLLADAVIIAILIAFPGLLTFVMQ